MYSNAFGDSNGAKTTGIRLASPAGLPLLGQHHLRRIRIQCPLRHDLLQPFVLFLQYSGLGFMAPLLPRSYTRTS